MLERLEACACIERGRVHTHLRPLCEHLISHAAPYPTLSHRSTPQRGTPKFVDGVRPIATSKVCVQLGRGNFGFGLRRGKLLARGK